MSSSPVSPSDIAALLSCPTCAGALPLGVNADDPNGGASPASAPTFHCPTCETAYPPVGGVACVFAEPHARVALWAEHLGAFHLGVEQALQVLEEQRRFPGILPLTQSRLSEQMRITRVVLEEVDALLVPAIGPPREPTTEVPGFESRESLRSLHRDWGWHDSDENDRALAFVQKVIKAPLGRTLILGAGACRLAYDLAARDPAAMFVAIDDDPLVLLPAARVLRGETLSVTEARPRATELTQLAAVRELRAPNGPTDRVFPLLADGLSPPVQAGTFDTVLTPWFIDIAPPDLRDLVGHVRRALAPGGRWLHFGPLLYPAERAPHCQFSREEILELARRAGFVMESQIAEMLPFSVSPLGEQIRHEACLAFWAPAGEVPADPPGEVPSWVVLPHLPVPDFDGRALFFHESPGFRRVFQLVDGQRSINQIVGGLGAPDADPAQLKDAVRQCLLEAHPGCRM